jgi:hypothetical protein
VDSGLALHLNDDVNDTHYSSVYHVTYFNGGIFHVDNAFGDVMTPAGSMDLGSATPDNQAAGIFARGEILIPHFHLAQRHSMFGRAATSGGSTRDFNEAWGLYDPEAGAPVQPQAGIYKIVLSTAANDGSGNYGFAAGSVFNLYGMPAV